MKNRITLIVLLLFLFALLLPLMVLAESPVPDELPDDFGGLTEFGYLTGLRKDFMPLKVFQDAAKYSDEDRDNAHRAALLIEKTVTAAFEADGKENKSYLWLRGLAYEILFQAEKDYAYKELALADFALTVSLGDTFAQADFDRVLEMELQSGSLDWEVAQILTAEDVAELFGLTAEDLLVYRSDYQTEDGSRRGAGYTLKASEWPEKAALFVLVDPTGGESRFDALKKQAFLGQVQEVTGPGDAAVFLALRNQANDPFRYDVLVVQKDELVLQVRALDRVWRGPEGEDELLALLSAVAARFLDNLFDLDHQRPELAELVLEMPSQGLQLDPGDAARSAVPDEEPEDLGGKTQYGFIMDLWGDYLKKDVFNDPEASEDDKNDVRRAARLIVNILNQKFDEQGHNMYELEIRGFAYEQAFLDTGQALFRQLALNDYKEALYTSYVLAKPGYDRLATPFLADYFALKKGDSGAEVETIQNWLQVLGFLEGEINGSFDEATEAAVQAFQEEHALTVNGEADLPFVLSLYAKVDDLDLLFDPLALD